MNTGLLPTHWTLNEVASLRIQPFRMPTSSKRNCRRAASFIMEKGHS